MKALVCTVLFAIAVHGSCLFAQEAPVTPPVDQAALDSRIRALQARLSEMLLVFTERHPDVISMRRQIESLDAQRAGQSESDSEEAERPAAEQEAPDRDTAPRPGN